MHQSSYEKMATFKNDYLSKEENLRILDIGSQDVNGSYRPLFIEDGWEYIGADMEAGKNVDVFLENPYIWRELDSSSFDVVISGQAFEHIQFFWITILEIHRILRPGGLVCIIAPSSGPEHRYPLDCWRFYTDGMISLAHFAQMEVLKASTQWENENHIDGSDWWHDSFLVCKKTDQGIMFNSKCAVKRWLQHKVLTIGYGNNR